MLCEHCPVLIGYFFSGKYIGKGKMKHVRELEEGESRKRKVLKSSVTGMKDFSAW